MNWTLLEIPTVAFVTVHSLRSYEQKNAEQSNLEMQSAAIREHVFDLLSRLFRGNVLYSLKFDEIKIAES